MRRRISLVALLCCLASPARGQDDPNVIFDMDTVRHKVGEITDKEKKKIPIGSAELVDGKFGQAVRFSFIENARGGFMMAGVRATPDWDKADGFSFWVKGDGSKSWGGIELIDKADFGKRYGYCFPTDSTEWRKITVRWADLTPELAAPLMDPKSGYAPSNLGNFWFGKWFYWQDYPAHSYAIDQVVLEPKIEPDPPPAFEPGLARLRAKLKDHKPITIVTMGDSLSDQHHWANKTVVWSQLLANDLKAKYGADVTIVNPAIGGTTLSQNIILIPRWAADAPQADLVTIWFGTNDWDNKIRGPRFAEYLRLAIDRVRRATGGHADILLMTTAPTFDRWETYAELEQAARDVAKEKQVGLVDTAAAFRKPPSADEAMRQGYWAWDKVHLRPKGHEVAKDAVTQALDAQP